MTCRGALLADQAALEQWKTSSPLLIMGSHRWNIPNSRGQIACGGERQAKLLQAVRYRYKQLLLYTRVFGILLRCIIVRCLLNHGLLVIANHDFWFIQLIKTYSWSIVCPNMGPIGCLQSHSCIIRPYNTALPQRSAMHCPE